MGESYISFNNVKFSYSSEPTPVINHCSFHVKEGDRVALRGESGAGKTTIFRLLMGFEQPDEGDILFKGQYLNHETVQEIRRQTAWLPQDLDLGSDTVESLINFPFQFEENRAKTPAQNTILKTFAKLGLSDSLLEKEFADLSTGQRQRTGIAICYLLDKPLILLDEPTSALDSASKEKVTDLLFSNATQTILSTSHDPWWIDKCDNIFDLNT